ncbi:MAG: hypothetical protein V5A68_06575 [Candidatus Thermoplasmatota archaeon]
MKNKMIILFVGILLISVGFSGCTENKNVNGNGDKKGDLEKFVGTWNTSNPIQWYIKPSFIFYENGSFAVGSYGGTYMVKDGKLELHWRDSETVYIYNYSFLDEDTLELTYIENGDKGIYNRQ